MKKWISLLLALMMLCLCGCEENTNTNVQPTQPEQTTAPAVTTEPDMQIVELTLRIADDGMWADSQAVDALLETFNAYYPNIIIHVEHGAAAAAEGEAPDIVLANIKDFARGDWALTSLEDLSDLWDKGLYEDVYQPLEALCVHPQGGMYAVPLALNPYCMAVNQAVFEEAEALTLLNTANHTWNTASFLKAVQAVYDNGMDTVGTIYCRDLAGDDLTRLLVSNLYDGSFLDRKTGTYNVAQEEMGKALAALAGQDGICFDPGQDADGTREAFLAGETGFLLNWSAVDQIRHSEDSNLLFMHYPSADSRPETRTEVYGFGIYKNSDVTKVAASRTFVAYMMGNRDAVRATGMLAARDSLKDAYDGTSLERTVKELNKLLTSLTEEEAAGEHWETARKLWVQTLGALGSAGENWQEALDNAQKDLNSLFPELFPPETEPSEPTQ